MNNNVNHAIKLLQIQFPEFSIHSFDALNPAATSEVEMDFGFGVGFAKENRFIVEFNLKLSNPKFKAQFKMIALFEANTTMDDAFKQSALVQVNAPAIAFPYLRSFITTVTVNAGYHSVVLPSINLTSLKK
jgi:preprotein translocase subunit SecB